MVENEAMLQKFASDFASIEGAKVLVHGGGVMASEMQKRLGIQPRMVQGRRITDASTLEIVTMVYAGWCNKHIVSTLQACGCNAIGLCGADGNAIRAVKRPPVKIYDEEGNATETDFGYVGDIDVSGIDCSMIGELTESGLTPVFCAITHDGKGNLLNTNADTIASSIACALAASSAERRGTGVELVYCFEKDGVLYEKDDPESVIPEITPSYYSDLKAEGRVADGMIPKLDNAFRALREGVSSVVIKNAANIGNEKGTRLSL